MIYLFETELNTEKSVLISLQQIFGIGKSTSKKICNSLGFSINLKIKNLTDSQVSELIEKVESLNLILSSDLKKNLSLNYAKQVSIKSYRGLRKLEGLPVRGQRTHSNAKTSRKKKQTQSN